MCGIAGIVHFDGKGVDQGELDRMTDALAHRGPDARGTYRDRNLGLGFRRLSILDLTEAGNQPMVSEDGNTVLVFNGEIYNFREERNRLEGKGIRFRSKTDTEVLLQLYRAEGEKCLERLRGMFAFCIYDKKKQILFLARDRVGKKPLKYFRHGTTFAFASELKALHTLPSCPRSVDEEVLWHFLTMMYVPAPSTGIQGIRKLPAAHAMIVDLATGEEHIWRYWAADFTPNPLPTKEEWQEEIRSTFEESVRLRMVADVPVGAFLSGGVDSGAVVAAMSRLSSRPVQTFSIGSGNDTMNELPAAAQVAKRYGTDHHPIVLEPDIVTLLPDLVAAYEEPFADPSVIPTYLVARETRKTVTVALNGDGGDENFAGYIRYPILRFSERYRRMPQFFHTLMQAGTGFFHRLRNDTFSYRIDRFQQTIGLPREQRYLQYLSFFTEEEKAFILRNGHPPFPRTDAWYAMRTSAARTRAKDLVHQAVSMDFDTYLADDLLPKVDMGTMAHGLEARSPLLDHRLLELTARIPVHHKLHGRTGKWIFKDMLQDELPAATLWSRKRGFRLPLDQWFRAELRTFVHDTIASSPPLFWEMFAREGVEQFLHRYETSRIDYSDHVWALLWLSQWMKRYT